MDYFFEPDEPLEAKQPDAFGTAGIAKSIAAAITAHRPVRGLVVGLEARWGTGKSTVLNAVEAELKEAATPPIVLRFSPWLVENRTALLTELLRQFQLSLEIETRKKRNRWDVIGHYRARQLKSNIERFARYAAHLQRALDTTGSYTKSLSELPVVGLVIVAARAILSVLVPILGKTPTISEIKGDVEQSIRVLNRHFVVLLDDIDRLDPRDSKEVLRLLRAAADFPFVTYVAAYDRQTMLSHDRDDQLDNRHYIDKIVQVPISLPEPDTSSLKQYLIRRLTESLEGRPAIIGRSLAGFDEPTHDSEHVRFINSLDAIIKTYLNTPRRIKILCNAIRVSWSPQSESDFSDFLIWASICEFDPPLREWAIQYRHAFVDYRAGRSSENYSLQLRARLETLLARPDFPRTDQLVLLSTILPPLRGYV